jgi:thiol:disulfide interchange protein DsbC
LTDATIYTFLMPLEGLHPDAKRKSVGVWCAKDRAKAWNDLMTRNVVTDGSCDAPIDRNIKLAERLGITGTPTLIFANGQVMPGAPRTDQLEQLLGAK